MARFDPITGLPSGASFDVFGLSHLRSDHGRLVSQRLGFDPLFGTSAAEPVLGGLFKTNATALAHYSLNHGLPDHVRDLLSTIGSTDAFASRFGLAAATDPSLAAVAAEAARVQSSVVDTILGRSAGLPDAVTAMRVWDGLYRHGLEDSTLLAAMRATDSLHVYAEQERRAADVLRASMLGSVGRAADDDIARIARWATSLAVPDAAVVGFGKLSGFGDTLAFGHPLTGSSFDTLRAVGADPSLQLIGVHGFGQVLDAVGFRLPKWRMLTNAERRARMDARLREKREDKYKKRARDFHAERELLLIDLLNERLEDAYGPDWPHERLPKCGCKPLLKKWIEKGEDTPVLIWGCFDEYRKIITHEEHWAEIFEPAFSDLDETHALFRKAGDLRAASVHPRPFGRQMYLEFRTTWRLIYQAMTAISTPMYDYDA